MQKIMKKCCRAIVKFNDNAVLRTRRETQD